MEPRNMESSSSLGALFDFSFTRFITLNILKFLYGLILVLIVLIWLVTVIGAFSQGAGPGIAALLVGTVFAMVEVILWRVVLEFIAVVFRIGENTSNLAGRQTPGSPPSEPPPAADSNAGPAPS